MSRICTPSLYLHRLVILACFAISNAFISEISCLRSIKESLEDPENSLSSWDFSNNTEGLICFFDGVSCWNDDESRVLNINLSDMRLRGPFPMGIRNCTSLTGLDLSNNQLTGPIPTNFSDVLPFLISLDLSYNNFSGPIPPSIGNCSFLSTLKLNNNHLTGEIPPQLGGLNRIWILDLSYNNFTGSIPSSIVNCSFINTLKLNNNHLTGEIPPQLGGLNFINEFSVSNNRLSGPIPIFSYSTFPAERYANNLGLCGVPLNACDDEDLIGLFLSGFEVGFSLFTILTMLFMFFCSPRSISNMLSYRKLKKKIMKKTRHLIPQSSQVVVSDETRSEEGKVNSSRSLSFTSSIYVFNTQVTAMENFIRRLGLRELKSFTNNFDNRNVIGYGNMGVMYKGVILNGFPVAVKRLHKFESYEKEFLSITEILGRLQHTNLIPLLGFCYERQNKFIVYKYISNGTVHQWLHSSQIGWTIRLKIAEGVARGLAWLHHNKVLKVAHLKITSKCILLDDNFEPKISNFGNAMKLVKASDTPSSSRNCVVQDLILYKEDVYSFGVLLLELITGKEPSTWINSPCGGKFNLIDECLMGKGFDEEIYATLKIAENCIKPHRGAISMLQVYQAMRAIGISRNGISDDSCIDVEDNEGDV